MRAKSAASAAVASPPIRRAVRARAQAARSPATLHAPLRAAISRSRQVCRAQPEDDLFVPSNLEDLQKDIDVYLKQKNQADGAAPCVHHLQITPKRPLCPISRDVVRAVLKRWLLCVRQRRRWRRSRLSAMMLCPMRCGCSGAVRLWKACSGSLMGDLNTWVYPALEY